MQKRIVPKRTAVILFLAVCAAALLCRPAAAAASSAGGGEPIRVGVTQFKVKNDIGLENAEVIVPEVLVSKLKEAGRYELSERVLLEKVLEEQKLQMSGLTDEETVAKVGEFYNISAVVSGSAMRVGSTITISGRLIDTETAQIIEAVTVKFEDIDELEARMREMAYRLSGWSAAEYERMAAMEKITRSRYGVRIGTAYQFNSTDADPSSLYAPLSFGLFFQSRRFDAEALGNIPVTSESSHFTLFCAYNPFVHLGFGLAGSFLYDGITGEKVSNASGMGHTAEYFTLLGGINYRANESLRANLYIGPTLAGQIQKFTTDEKLVKCDADAASDPLGNMGILLNIEYRIIEHLSLMLSYLSQQGEGYPDLLDGDSLHMNSSYLSLTGGYSFSLR